jgi:hypothetical protein
MSWMHILNELLNSNYGVRRSLDCAIAETLGWSTYYEEDGNERLTRWLDPGRRKAVVPKYTSSIEAALTLLPSDRQVSVLHSVTREERTGEIDIADVARRICVEAVQIKIARRLVHPDVLS